MTRVILHSIYKPFLYLFMLIRVLFKLVGNTLGVIKKVVSTFFSSVVCRVLFWIFLFILIYLFWGFLPNLIAIDGPLGATVYLLTPMLFLAIILYTGWVLYSIIEVFQGDIDIDDEPRFVVFIWEKIDKFLHDIVTDEHLLRDELKNKMKDKKEKKRIKKEKKAEEKKKIEEEKRKEKNKFGRFDIMEVGGKND